MEEGLKNSLQTKYIINFIIKQWNKAAILETLTRESEK